MKIIVGLCLIVTILHLAACAKSTTESSATAPKLLPKPSVIPTSDSEPALVQQPVTLERNGHPILTAFFSSACTSWEYIPRQVQSTYLMMTSGISSRKLDNTRRAVYVANLEFGIVPSTSKQDLDDLKAEIFKIHKSSRNCTPSSPKDILLNSRSVNEDNMKMKASEPTAKGTLAMKSPFASGTYSDLSDSSVIYQMDATDPDTANEITRMVRLSASEPVKLGAMIYSFDNKEYPIEIVAKDLKESDLTLSWLKKPVLVCAQAHFAEQSELFKNAERSDQLVPLYENCVKESKP